MKRKYSGKERRISSTRVTMKEKLKNFGTAMIHGDIFVKLTALWWGLGYARRKQYVKALLMTLLEAIVVIFTVKVSMEYVPKFTTLGTVKAEKVFNIKTMKNEWNDYDNSFMILLMSLFSFIVWIAGIFTLVSAVEGSYRLQLKEKAGEHINKFSEDFKSLLDEKFPVAMLSLPALGVVIFTVIPILFLVFVAFTNYDQNHMPPAELFSWVGVKNFVALFGGGSMGANFGYAFVKVLGWTLIWAVFATFTTYFGGILLALLINSKDTIFPKVWRVLFVITIAVPQFVSLLLIRSMFSNTGIVNHMLGSIGVIDWLKNIGMIGTSYVPFLSAPGWAHVMIILINIWVGVPYQMLIATGILMNIPTDQLESAKIDGATKWQQFIHVTMPYVFFITGPTLVTDFVKNINNFNVIYLLTQSVYTTTDQKLGNANAKEVDLLVTWLFSLTQDYYNYKMAATIGIMVFVVCAIVTLLSFNFLIKGDKEGVYN